MISFNLSTSISTSQQWEDWFERALALRPESDWFGLHTYHAPVTCLDGPDAYAGAIGLTNVRKFLDRHADLRESRGVTQIWKNPHAAGTLSS